MQVPGQVDPEFNDSSCRDRGAGGTGERQATRGISAAGAVLAEPREEVGSRFAGECKRLMYDRRKKERS